MESAQAQLLSVLLARLWAKGLLSQATYRRALDIVHSTTDFPAFFGVPVCLTREGEERADTQDPR